MRLYGVPVQPDEARRLVATLLADGSPYAVAAACTIDHGLDLGAALVALTIAERDAILAVLEDVQSQGLGELRGALMLDALERRDAPSLDG